MDDGRQDGRGPVMQSPREALAEAWTKLWSRVHEEHEWDDFDWRGSVAAACAGVRAAWAGVVAAAGPESVTSEARAALVRALVQAGDELFYGSGESRAALSVFELVIEVDAASPEGYKGCLVCWLQGAEIDPAAALPFAEKLAELDPARRRDLEYVRELLRRQ
jgi:hypothetical protein